MRISLIDPVLHALKFGDRPAFQGTVELEHRWSTTNDDGHGNLDAGGHEAGRWRTPNLDAGGHEIWTPPDCFADDAMN
jgi:hypothetical protein